MSRALVKICGVRSIDEAILAADAGADAIGLNFVPSSRRRVDPRGAMFLSGAVRGRLDVVGVVADLDDDALAALVVQARLDALQLHGSEPPEQVARVAARTGVRVYKAVRVGEAVDVARALAYPGELLVDAKVDGALGGTGARADWELATELARTRRVWLAGGLDPTNVAAAIRTVRPFGVDVASGVEFRDAVPKAARGRIDPDRVRAFVAAARSVD